MTDWLAFASPAYLLFAGALLMLALRGRAQDILFLAVPLAALALVWLVPPGSGGKLEWLGLTLTPVMADWLSRLFGTAFGLAAIFGALFAFDRRNTAERAAVLLYAGAAQGIVLAGDLATLFIYWEVMAIGSTLVIFANGAVRPGFRYAVMHIFGGVLLLAGVVIVAQEPSGLSLRAFRADSIGTWLLLAGVLVNAGAPPVSTWVPDAYPRASWSGSVFLSAFTTKAAVAVLIRLFPGEPVLVGIGLFMAAYGLVYALIENDIRRLLSYSIVGQVGFMIVAIGIGTPLALGAAAAHAFCHILYKSLLMMGAGSVLRATGETRLSALGGLAAAMPMTATAVVVGGLSLAAAPFTAGFVSKSALLASLGDTHTALAWFGLTAISAGSMVYAGLKLPFFAFFRAAPARELSPLPRTMPIAMAGLAATNILFGVRPDWLMALSPDIDGVKVLTPDHILFQLQLIGGSVVCFAMLLKLLSPAAIVAIDFDWLWRVAPLRIWNWAAPSVRHAVGRLAPLRAAAEAQISAIVPRWPARLSDGANWLTGDIALAATALLAIVLLIAAL